MVHRRWRSIVAATALAVITGAAPGGPVAGASPQPAAEVVPAFWVIATVDDPDVRGILAISGQGSGDPVPTESISFNFAQMAVDTIFRLAGMSSACGDQLQPEDRVLTRAFRSDARGTRYRSYRADLTDVLVTSVHSVRIFKGALGANEIACAEATSYSHLGSANTVASTTSAGLRPLGPPAGADAVLAIGKSDVGQGIVVAAGAGNDQISLVASLSGLRPLLRHRIVGGLAACGQVWKPADRAFRTAFRSTARGAAFVRRVVDELQPMEIGQILGVAVGDVNGDNVDCTKADAYLDESG